jgi:hypothetical protein
MDTLKAELLAGTAAAPQPKFQTRDVARHFGVSTRTVDRWQRDENLGFPQPMLINGRKYWDAASIVKFDNKQRVAADARP